MKPVYCSCAWCRLIRWKGWPRVVGVLMVLIVLFAIGADIYKTGVVDGRKEGEAISYQDGFKDGREAERKLWANGYVSTRYNTFTVDTLTIIQSPDGTTLKRAQDTARKVEGKK